jgi:site-specific DNA-methyltransferase (adenine-specific)
MSIEFNKIYNMDCLEGLRQIDDDTIDAIISDPPYQLSPTGKGLNQGSYGKYKRISAGFMGKEWDVLPTTEILKESLRVLKPGAFALWLMTPRQDSQLEFLLRLREAGFIISFTPIYWTYASGFPKSMNISKAVDKKLGAERDRIESTGSMHKSNIYGWSAFGKNKDEHLMPSNIPITLEAKKLNGSYAGFQPKPAIEVIIVSMKPLSEKTYVDQALKNGKGITWLDDCRIPYVSEEEYEKTKRGIRTIPKDNLYSGGWKTVDTDLYHDRRGRFPANLLVSDNAIDIGINKKSKRSLRKPDNGGSGNSLIFKHENLEFRGYDDSGDLSHYFSLDAWWEQKVKDLPKEMQKIFPFLYVPKASKTERNKGIDNLPKMQNHHPTVKPIKLMSYLITLTTREGDMVLDPFIGSGTTAISSILLNRKFIGFERDPEYFQIAQERIKYYQSQKKVIENE